MSDPITTIPVKPKPEAGYRTSEFWFLVGLYAFSAYTLYKGVSTEQIIDVVAQVEDRVTNTQGMFDTLIGLVTPLVGQMFYIKKRTELK